MKTSCEIKYFDIPTEQAPSDNNYRMLKSLELVDDKYIFTASVDNIDSIVRDADGCLLGNQVIEMSLEVKSRKGLVLYKGPLMGNCSDDKWREVFFTETLSCNKLSADHITKYIKQVIRHQLFVNLFNGTKSPVGDNGSDVNFEHIALHFTILHHNQQSKNYLGNHNCSFSMGLFGDFEIRYLVIYKFNYHDSPTELSIVRTVAKLNPCKATNNANEIDNSFMVSARFPERIPTVDEVKSKFTELLQSVLEA